MHVVRLMLNAGNASGRTTLRSGTRVLFLQKVQGLVARGISGNKPVVVYTPDVVVTGILDEHGACRQPVIKDGFILGPGYAIPWGLSSAKWPAPAEEHPRFADAFEV